MKIRASFILLILSITFLGAATTVDAYVRVKSYYRKSGSYVKSHYRSNSNSYKYDNWSSKGNTNPFTGKKGTLSY